MERTEYDEQAEQFLEEHGLEIVAAFKGDKCCPAWEDAGHTHGDRYRVTIKRRLGHGGWEDSAAYPQAASRGLFQKKSISFDFWNSVNDKAEGKRPSAYDVLACISGDAFASTNPDEVAEDYGDMKPSQAIAIAKFAKRLQAFFMRDELEALSEIS